MSSPDWLSVALGTEQVCHQPDGAGLVVVQPEPQPEPVEVPLPPPGPNPRPGAPGCLTRADCRSRGACLAGAFRTRWAATMALDCGGCRAYVPLTPEQRQEDMPMLVALGEYIAADHLDGELEDDAT